MQKNRQGRWNLLCAWMIHLSGRLLFNRLFLNNGESLTSETKFIEQCHCSDLKALIENIQKDARPFYTRQH